jgi:hypothetical protein
VRAIGSNSRKPAGDATSNQPIMKPERLSALPEGRGRPLRNPSHLRRGDPGTSRPLPRPSWPGLPPARWPDFTPPLTGRDYARSICGYRSRSAGVLERPASLPEPSIALWSIFRRGLAAGGSNTECDTDCNMIRLLMFDGCAKPRPRGPSPFFPFFGQTGAHAPGWPSPRTGVASGTKNRRRAHKRKRGASGDRLFFVKRAREVALSLHLREGS